MIMTYEDLKTCRYHCEVEIANVKSYVVEMCNAGCG